MMHQGAGRAIPVPKQETNALQPRDQIAPPSPTPSVGGQSVGFPVSAGWGHCQDSYGVSRRGEMLTR